MVLMHLRRIFFLSYNSIPSTIHILFCGGMERLLLGGQDELCSSLSKIFTQAGNGILT